MRDIAAAVIPVPEVVASRILKEHRTVFVKYTHQKYRKGKNKTSIKPGTKLIIYQTKGEKMLVGEATIEKITFLLPSDALRIYGDRLCLNADELNEYSSQYPNRNEKPMLVLELNGPKTFPNPIIWPHKINMMGKFLDQKEYESLF